MKKLTKMIFSILFISTLFTSFSFAAASYYGNDHIKSGSIYTIRNVGSNRVLDVLDGRYDPSAPIIGYWYHGSDNQRWQVNVEKIDGDDIFVTLISKRSNLAIMYEREFTSGFTQERYSGDRSQMFKLTRVGTTNQYKITNQLWNSYPLKSTSDSPVIGTDFVEYSDNENFYWTFELHDDKRSHQQVIRDWAPDVYQDFNAMFLQAWRYDYITAFNFDGDWRGDNNWENADYGSKAAYTYASIQETSSHYFITYNFFHPRDVGIDAFLGLVIPDCHENDLEGALFVVKKDSALGTLEAVYTIAHGGFDTYTGDAIKKDSTTNRVKLFMASNGPLVGEHGHSVHMYDSSKPNGGVKYSYNQIADELNYIMKASWNPSTDDNSYKSHDYGIKLLDELWDRRFDYGPDDPFHSYGAFSGDWSGIASIAGIKMGSNKCNPPWAWQDGLWLSDPAFFADKHSSFSSMSHNYTFNKYFAYKIVVNGTQPLVNKDPIRNKEADIFVRVTVDGTKFIDVDDWKYNNAPNHQWKNFNFGTNDAEGSARYTENIDTIYVAKPRNSSIIFELRDRDGGNNDDSMGTITKTVSPGHFIDFHQNTNNNEALFHAEVYSRME